MDFATQHDVGATLVSAPECLFDAEVITAGAGNDNVEVNGNAINRLLEGRAQHLSAKVALAYKTVLTDLKTLSLALKLQTASDSGFSSPTTVTPKRIRLIQSDGTITDLTSSLSSGALPATVLETADGATTARGVIEADYDLQGCDKYIRGVRTSDLSHTGTDTAAWSSMLTFGGGDVVPSTL